MERIGGGSGFGPVVYQGRAYAIIVHEVNIFGEPIQVGDGVGIFDGPVCVGVSEFEGEWPFQLTAFEGAGNTGFQNGNPISFRIWSESMVEEYSTNAEFSHGDGTFGNGGYAEVTLAAQAILAMNLQANYFELISFNLLPYEETAEAILNPLENLLIAYMDDGRFGMPDLGIEIGEISITEGIRVFCESTEYLAVEGGAIDLEALYHLGGNQWNWIGFPLMAGIPATSALRQIEDLVSIVSDDEGNFWIPELG